jgi:hypothetical protein
VPYSPLPTALASKLQQMLGQMANAPPSPEEQLGLEGKKAQIAKDLSQAGHHQAQANVLNSEAGTRAGAQDAAAKKDLAQAAKYVSDTIHADQPAPLPALEDIH